MALLQIFPIEWNFNFISTMDLFSSFNSDVQKATATDCFYKQFFL